MPPARQQGHPRNSRQARHVRFAGQAWERRIQSGQAGGKWSAASAPGQGARPRHVRRLDHPHRRRRTAARAAAAARRRAQRRHHALGLGRPQGLSARRDRHRQAQPHRQRQRPALRRAGTEHGHSPGARPGAPQGDRRSQMPVRDPKTPRPGKPLAASPYWGEEAIWDSQANMHNPDVRREGPRLVHLGHPAAGQSGLLQGGLRPSVGQALPAEPQRPPARLLRPEDEASSPSSTPASARTTCSSPRTPTTRSGPAAAAAATRSAGST